MAAGTELLCNDPLFEKAYLALFLRDQDFFCYTYQDLTPELFPNPTVQRLVRIILAHTKETGAIPDNLILHDIEKYKNNLEPEAYNSLVSLVNDLLAMPLRDKKYLLKEHDKFVKSRLLKDMLPKLVEYGRAGDDAKVTKLFQDYISFRPKGLMDPGREYNARDIEARIKRRLEQEEEDRFYFLISPLDQAGVYFGRKDLVLFQSQKTSLGKTTILMNIVRNLVFQELKVLVYTLEEDEEEIEDILDQTVCGLTTEELVDREKLQRKLGQWIDGQVRVKEFGAYMTKVSDLIGHYNMLGSYFNWRPDVVVINAGNDLVSDRFKDNLYGSGLDIFQQLKAWAKSEEIAVIVDTQSQRGAAEKTVADTNDAGGSIAKVELATHVITINRTPAESKENLVTLNVGKNRKGPAHFTVTFNTDLARRQFYVRPPE